MLFADRMAPRLYPQVGRNGCPLEQGRRGARLSSGDSRLVSARSQRLDSQAGTLVREYFDAQAGVPVRRLHRFYYRDLHGYIRHVVPPGARVLDLGCGDGRVLASLLPSYGVGVDISPRMVEEAKRLHPHLTFICADVQEIPVSGHFDYIVASNVVGHLSDVWAFFRGLRQLAGPSTRVILTYYNFAWEPLLNLAERLGLKSKEPLQNWLSRTDLINLLDLADFEPVSSGYRLPIPVGPSFVTGPLNRFLGPMPLIRRFGITSYVSARPIGADRTQTRTESDATCSVVIPARNERGNIRPAIERLPRLGAHVEVIFVEGGSSDGTADEIRALIADNPQLDVKLVDQGKGKGKGDAVRKGFDAASGDVLMILDADLTVPPEDLPKFWKAIVEGKGELISGSRLVYPMEAQAMRLANIAGNKVFSMIFSWILDDRITDTLCGTKVLWSKDYRRIAANRAAFGDFDPFGDFDLLFGAAKLGLKIREVPVRYRDRTYGRTNISRWRHGVLLLRMSLIGARKLRFR